MNFRKPREIGFGPNVTENLTKLINRHEWVIEKIKKASGDISCSRYETARNSLKGIITYYTEFESPNVYFYGSRLTGVSTWLSDLDLYVDVGKYFANLQDD
jgi:hypothetical protein